MVKQYLMLRNNNANKARFIAIPRLQRHTIPTSYKVTNTLQPGNCLAAMIHFAIF